MNIRKVARFYVVALGLSASGCTVPITQRAPVNQVVEAVRKPVDVRLTLNNGRKVNIWRSTLVGDSLVGSADPDDESTRMLAVAISDVRTVAVRKFSLIDTLLFICAASYAAAYAVLVVSMWYSARGL